MRDFYYAMLGHHVDTTDVAVTPIACLFLDLLKTLPDHLSLETFISYADYDPFEALPNGLRRRVLGLLRVFHGTRITGEAPHYEHTFMLFLLDSFPASSLSIRIGPPEVTRLHISICQNIMAKELRFNICESPSSFLQNKDVPNIEALKREHISSHLGYACRYWVDQVSKVETLDPDLLDMLFEFFHTHFLHWLEVMSLLGLSPVEALKSLSPIRVCDSIFTDTMIELLI